MHCKFIWEKVRGRKNLYKKKKMCVFAGVRVQPRVKSVFGYQRWVTCHLPAHVQPVR